MNAKPNKARLSILDLGAMDRDLIRDICRQYGYMRFACYRITQDSATLLMDTGQTADAPTPPTIDCSSYYYTAKSRMILASGWQTLPKEIKANSPSLRGWKSYLPVQDLWSNHILFFVKIDGRRTGGPGDLDGFLEALGRRFHYWIAGDELRHFIDDTTSMEHMHAFSNQLSQLLSHEIRNPVTNLMSLSQTHEMLSAGTAYDQANFASEVGRFAQQIWTIIQKIELLTNTDQSSTNPNQESAQLLDMHEILQTCIDREVANRSDTTSKVIVSISESRLIVQGIPALISLALRELIKNAIQFANGTPIKIQAYPSGENLIVDVEEEGMPVPPGHEELIFLRYFQGPKNSGQKKSVQRGMGLGLYVARFVCSLHAGQLLFVRSIGKKGTFRMILPLAEESIQKRAS